MSADVIAEGKARLKGLSSILKRVHHDHKAMKRQCDKKAAEAESKRNEKEKGILSIGQQLQEKEETGEKKSAELEAEGGHKAWSAFNGLAGLDKIAIASCASAIVSGPLRDAVQKESAKSEVEVIKSLKKDEKIPDQAARIRGLKNKVSGVSRDLEEASTRLLSRDQNTKSLQDVLTKIESDNDFNFEAKSQAQSGQIELMAFQLRKKDGKVKFILVKDGSELPMDKIEVQNSLEKNLDENKDMCSIEKQEGTITTDQKLKAKTMEQAIHIRRHEIQIEELEAEIKELSQITKDGEKTECNVDLPTPPNSPKPPFSVLHGWISVHHPSMDSLLLISFISRSHPR
ncbi:hypothetical protein K469DRAFT_690613 [Zopfia rhizophila CBS 207.26]|uniref:Uncharacterized protein n=1 Tax=Zopfia rhizophila CBS 207.26 TaxID=1314779 RepID=A0A6A6DT99_9PEZI|nr:hypothetical protein K469DRAFT_690613 [Zopfia rhizophila CBS 207.26]